MSFEYQDFKSWLMIVLMYRFSHIYSGLVTFWREIVRQNDSLPNNNVGTVISRNEL